MHDVTKRGLALAVATGGLLITGAAPAVSAVSTHPEHPDHAGKKSQPSDGSSHRAAAISVSGSQVKQYVGRHKAADGGAGRTADKPDAAAAAPRHTAAAHRAAPARHAGTASRHGATHAATHRAAAPHRPQHAGTAPHGAPASYPEHPAQPAHPAYPAHPAAAGAQAEASALGGGGLLTGNTVEVPVDAPVNICGVVATVLGGEDHAAGNHCFNGPDTAGGPNSSAAAEAAGSPGTLSGNVVQVPVSLPANICGDTATVVGGHDSAEDVLCANNGGPTYSAAQAATADSPGLGSGNVVQVPVDAPLNVCGITANVVAVDDTAAGNKCANGGEHGGEHGHEQAWPHPAYGAGTPGPTAGAGANAVSANSSGAVTGNVVQVPIQAPINACGDTVDVVGAFNSALDNRCVNETAGGAAANATATGDNGLAAGNVAQLPINIPTEVCGVVAAAGAYGDTAAGTTCVNTGASTTTTSADTAGETGFVTGNVAQSSVNAPVHVCGTTVGAGIVNSGSQDTDCGTGPACPPPPPTECTPPVFPPPPPPPPDFPPPPGHHHHHHGPHCEHHPEQHGVPSNEEIGRLPRTGADVLDYAGIGAGALVLGAGVVIAARRKSGSAN